MELFLHEFKSSDPPLNLQTLFETAVFYNKELDVEYLLKNYRSRIFPFANNFYAFRMAYRLKNFSLLNKLFCLCGPSPPIPMSIIEIVPPLIAFVLPAIRKSKQLNKALALKFLDIALLHNDQFLLKCLINNDIEEFVSDYRFLLVICGANRLDIVQQPQYFALVPDLVDECVETAFLCKAKDVLIFLKEKFAITNPFLKEKVHEVVRF
jgi:hypothetical protein